MGQASYGGTVTINLRPWKQRAQLEPRPRRKPRAGTYRRLLVPLSPGPEAGRAVRIACELAADRDAQLTAAAVIEVPLEAPLASPDAHAEAAAREAVRTAQALGMTYGVSVEGVVVHARDAGEAIVGEAEERQAQVVVLAAEWPAGRGRIRRLGRVTDHVLKRAPCRVLLIGGEGARGVDPVFRSGRPSDYWPAGEFVDASASR